MACLWGGSGLLIVRPYNTTDIYTKTQLDNNYYNKMCVYIYIYMRIIMIFYILSLFDPTVRSFENFLIILLYFFLVALYFFNLWFKLLFEKSSFLEMVLVQDTNMLLEEFAFCLIIFWEFTLRLDLLIKTDVLILLVLYFIKNAIVIFLMNRL